MEFCERCNEKIFPAEDRVYKTVNGKRVVYHGYCNPRRNNAALREHPEAWGEAVEEDRKKSA